MLTKANIPSLNQSIHKDEVCKLINQFPPRNIITSDYHHLRLQQQFQWNNDSIIWLTVASNENGGTINRPLWHHKYESFEI